MFFGSISITKLISSAIMITDLVILFKKSSIHVKLTSIDIKSPLVKPGMLLFADVHTSKDKGRESVIASSSAQSTDVPFVLFSTFPEEIVSCVPFTS